MDTLKAGMKDTLEWEVTERLRDYQHVAQQAQLLELAHEAIIVREPVESRIVFVPS